MSHRLWNREPAESVTHMLCDVVVLLQTVYDLRCSVHDGLEFVAIFAGTPASRQLL